MDTDNRLWIIIRTGSARNHHPDYIRALVNAAPVADHFESIADPCYRFCADLTDSEDWSVSELKAIADMLKYAGFTGVVHEGDGGVEADSVEELIAEGFLFHMRENNDCWGMLPALYLAGFISHARYVAYQREREETAA